MTLYSVNITDYEDDYKHRYDSGVYVSKPKIFKNEQDAIKYLQGQILYRIRQFDFSENKLIEVFPKFKDYFLIDEKGNYFFRDTQNIHDDIQNFFTGEFVDFTFEYDISKIEVD
jgi:hypothetical protein